MNRNRRRQRRRRRTMIQDRHRTLLLRPSRGRRPRCLTATIQQCHLRPRQRGRSRTSRTRRTRTSSGSATTGGIVGGSLGAIPRVPQNSRRALCQMTISGVSRGHIIVTISGLSRRVNSRRALGQIIGQTIIVTISGVRRRMTVRGGGISQKTSGGQILQNSSRAIGQISIRDRLRRRSGSLGRLIMRDRLRRRSRSQLIRMTNRLRRRSGNQLGRGTSMSRVRRRGVCGVMLTRRQLPRSLRRGLMRTFGVI